MRLCLTGHVGAAADTSSSGVCHKFLPFKFCFLRQKESCFFYVLEGVFLGIYFVEYSFFCGPVHPSALALALR